MSTVLKVLRKAGRRKLLAGIGAGSVVVLFGLLYMGSLWADESTTAPDDPAANPVPTLNPGSMVLRIIGSVALVIGVLYAGMYAMRMLSKRGGGGNLKKDAISVLQRRFIAPKKAIYVVTVGNRAMVVGVTDAQISHLTDLTEDELESIKAGEPDKTKQFKEHLRDFGFRLRGEG